MNEYFISDTHFNHNNIILFCDRPFTSTEHMNSYLIQQWNKTITKRDKIFFLGDFYFGNKTEIKNIVQQLNGYKIIILGNHDRHITYKWWIQESGFDEVYKYPIILDEYIICSHEPVFLNPNTQPYINIHGHVHNNPMYKPVTECSYNACVEMNNYTPICKSDVLKQIELYKASQNPNT